MSPAVALHVGFWAGTLLQIFGLTRADSLGDYLLFVFLAVVWLAFCMWVGVNPRPHGSAYPKAGS